MSIAMHQLVKKALEIAEKAQKSADDAQQAISILSAEVRTLKEKEKIGQDGTRRPNR